MQIFRTVEYLKITNILMENPKVCKSTWSRPTYIQYQSSQWASSCLLKSKMTMYGTDRLSVACFEIKNSRNCISTPP